MNMYVGITDFDWFNNLSGRNFDEVNFWKPGGQACFNAISTNDMFLFKLHAPYKKIVGGGFFIRYSILPAYIAWETFGIKNGTNSYDELNRRIIKYKHRNGMNENNTNIGCIILTEPFFFDEEDWITPPEDWAGSIVQGKKYSTENTIGSRLYNDVIERLKYKQNDRTDYRLDDIPTNRYGAEQIILPRLGQGTFKIVITETYHRRCSISGEKTLPVLDAAHIKPFSCEGPNITRNGLLLRKDIHALFDQGYITVNDELKVEVSHRLKEDFGNGKIYYEFHGKDLVIKPDNKLDNPDKDFLHWHNENRFLG